jgi:hypothetical protein
MQLNISQPVGYPIHGFFFGTNQGGPGSKPPGGEVPLEPEEPNEDTATPDTDEEEEPGTSTGT